MNDWFDNTLGNRLNNQETGAIIIVMQRLHAHDLVAHVQERESWDVLKFPAIAEQDETYPIITPYGRKLIQRKSGEILQPTRMSLETAEKRRQANGYNFAAQYQQEPQPPSGLIVKREWLKFYGKKDKPEIFDQVIQSWDTAIKSTEASNYSVCTTWGLKNHRLYLLDVYRRKLEFPELKRAVHEQAKLHKPRIVLIEDKASGSSLIPQLRSEGFSIVQAAPAMDGDKVMRLSTQTPKIEGGFVLFPKKAPWLDEYLKELIGFPNSKHDDQVDSTVFALAWFESKASSYGLTKESVERLENLFGMSSYFGPLHWRGRRF